MINYHMRKYEIIAPAVKNDGSYSAYAKYMREALADAGFEGWTESQTLGYWQGKLEPGTMFTVYSPVTRNSGHSTLNILSKLARDVMTDQGAIQVVLAPDIYQLVEA